MLQRTTTSLFPGSRPCFPEPSLRQSVWPHHDVTQAELVYAVQQELACTVTDILARRTHIAFSACQGLDFLSNLADLLRRYSHVTPARIEEQLEDYRRFLAQGLSFRDAPSASGSVAQPAVAKPLW